MIIFNLFCKLQQKLINKIMKRKKVSVIINCLNGSKFIKKCLKSVLNQTYKNLEIILYFEISFIVNLIVVKELNN